MPDKQIIDVTKCVHFDKSDIPNGCTCYWDGECNHYCYYKKYTYKHQECEELKKIIQRHDNDNNALLKEVEDKLCEYYRRYRECLTDIKEIAEKDFNHTCWETYARQLKQILQKISECKGDYNEKIR